MKNFDNWVRSKYCGEFRADDIDKEVIALGWVGKYRNLGTLIFIDVRDREGLVQVAFDKNLVDEQIFTLACSLRNEFVVGVKGIVRHRGENVNNLLATGEIEILANDLIVFSESETTPFIISDKVMANEAIRLKYRYLDLRRPQLTKTIILRNKMTKLIRDYMDENGFLEIETPFLGKSTPEGARDYLVPSRIHQGTFYALPQSPQLYKQLLMIAGFDKYYQIARCFRDEDLRANRQPEFTQVDLELSFVRSPEDVMIIAEGLIRTLFKKILNYDIGTVRRMPYSEAMQDYGSDKPDTRFGLKINDLSQTVQNCGFTVFDNALSIGGSVRAINAKGFGEKLTRKQIDSLGEFVKTFGAKGLAYINIKSEGAASSIQKFLSAETFNQIISQVNGEVGDIIFIVADKNKVVFDSLGQLRLKLADMGQLIDKNSYDILWVTKFPMLSWNDELGRYQAEHHPFTMPLRADIPLLDSQPDKVRSETYDLVINGEEAGGGSVRIHSSELQSKMFNLLGMDDEQIKQRFGFFVDAFKYGAPPHGGLAFGLDRLVMLFSKQESIKEVIAFPKVQNASCLMSEAPAEVDPYQLDDLGIGVLDNKKSE